MSKRQRESQHLFKPARLLRLLFGICAALLLPVSLPAQFYFDVNGNTAGSGLSASGSYSWHDNHWTSLSAGANVGNPAGAWSGGEQAVFSADTDGAVAFTVTIAANTLVSSILIEEGTPTLSVGSGYTLTLSGGVSSSGNTNLRLGGAGDISISGAIATGTGSLTKDGAGSLTLAGLNTYTGPTRIESGTLLLSGGDDRLSTTGGIDVDGGTLDLGGNSQSTSGYVWLRNSGTITNGTLNQNGDNFSVQSGTIGAVLGGTGGLVKNDSGTVTLSGANTFTGGTVVQGGTLVLSGGDNRLSTSGSIRVAAGSLDLGGTSQTTSAAVELGSGSIVNGTLNKIGGSYLVLEGTISAALGGNAGLAKISSGTVTLSGTNTYTGATTVSAGTLELVGSLASASAVTVESGAVLSLGGSASLGSLTLAGGTLEALSAGTRTLGALALQGASVLTLNSTFATTLNFSATDAATLWQTGSTLTIQNYNAALHILHFAGTTLTSTDLAKITFEGFGLAGFDANTGLLTAAIPEPSTYALLAGLAVLTLTWSWRRARPRAPQQG